MLTFGWIAHSTMNEWFKNQIGQIGILLENIFFSWCLTPGIWVSVKSLFLKYYIELYWILHRCCYLWYFWKKNQLNRMPSWVSPFESAFPRLLLRKKQDSFDALYQTFHVLSFYKILLSAAYNKSEWELLMWRKHFIQDSNWNKCGELKKREEQQPLSRKD